MVSGLPEDTAAHKGMSMGAAKMLKRLLPVLDRTFQQFPHYDLILTGMTRLTLNSWIRVQETWALNNFSTIIQSCNDILIRDASTERAKQE